MEAEDQTISVASSFAGYQEGKCQLSILLHFFFSNMFGHFNDKLASPAVG
jgi:hypothetical protein